MLYAELDAFEPVAIHEHESGDTWRVFFRTPALRDRARRALAAEFENALELHAVDVDDEDWARRSQASLTSVRAGRIVVAPPWDVPPSSDRQQAARARAPEGNDDIVIVIDPSTGFGTGHHATTRLCLELLQELDVRGKRVIDVGTGSGVLAIAASKLGAQEVVAMDNDPDALRNARENVERNGAGGAIDVAEVDLAAADVPPADVVVANLTSAVLQRSAASLRRMAKRGGVLIASGFGPDDVDDVVRALNASPSKVARDGDWAALSGNLRP